MRAGLHLEVRSVGIALHANSSQDSLKSPVRRELSSNSSKDTQVGTLKQILSDKRRSTEISCVPWTKFARRADLARRFWVRQSHIEQESRTRPHVAELEFVHEESQWLLIGATDLRTAFSAANSMILMFEWLESFMGSRLPVAGTKTRMPSARMLTRRPLMRPARVLRIESFETTISGGPCWEP